MAARICNLCSEFIHWNIPNDEKWSGAVFPHYERTSLLRMSADMNCHLCTLILQSLYNSRRPKGEIDLPDRQIWLEYAPADFSGKFTRISASIQPESLETAGYHKILEVPNDCGYMKIPNGLGADFLDMISNERNPFGEDVLWVWWKAEAPKYYLGSNTISADLFWAIVLPYHTGSLELVRLADDVSSVLERCLTLEDTSTGSEGALSLASSWLNTCRSSHERCNMASTSDSCLPSRVLNVGRHDTQEQPFLYTSKHREKGQYLTLSHRWGTVRQCTTTKANIQQRSKSIRLGEMSQTFRDAITVTRRLGFKYLWIDSLCIIQDSRDDWKAESEKMGEIYHNSMLTIAALDAEDIGPGCFWPRERLQSYPCKIGTRLPYHRPGGGTGGQVYAFPSSRNSPPDDIIRRRGLLDRRSWVLQEQLLSPRTLNFGKLGIYWECLTTELSELMLDGADSTHRFDTDFVQIFKAGIGGIMDISSPNSPCEDDLKFHRAWWLVVEVYSRRQLTRESDKLVALSGVATEVARVTKDEYLAGLWLRYLWQDLTWYVWAPGCPSLVTSHGYKGPYGPTSRLLEDFKAPSWSWTGIYGHILYTEQPGVDKERNRSPMIKVVRAECTAAEAGCAKYWIFGRIRLRGMLKEALAIESLPDNLPVEQQQEMWEAEVKLAQISAYENDSLPLKQKSTTSEFREKGTSADLLLGLPDTTSSYSDGQLQEDFLEDFAAVPGVVRSSRTNLTAHPRLASSQSRMRSDTTIVIDERDLNDNLKSMNRELGFKEKTSDWLHSQTASEHWLINPYSFLRIGGWAPDLLRHERLSSVLFLGISRNEGSVYCLGLVKTNSTDEEYRRIGLGFWNSIEWDSMNGGEDKELEII